MKNQILILWHKIMAKLSGGYKTEDGIRRHLEVLFRQAKSGPVPRGAKSGLYKFIDSK